MNMNDLRIVITPFEGGARWQAVIWDSKENIPLWADNRKMLSPEATAYNAKRALRGLMP